MSPTLAELGSVNKALSDYVQATQGMWRPAWRAASKKPKARFRAKAQDKAQQGFNWAKQQADQGADDFIQRNAPKIKASAKQGTDEMFEETVKPKVDQTLNQVSDVARKARNRLIAGGVVGGGALAGGGAAGYGIKRHHEKKRKPQQRAIGR